MQTEKIFDLLYVHSPITYSIGRHLFENGYFQNEPLVVCARKTGWEGAHLEVDNDGVWSIGGTCDYLETVCNAIRQYPEVGLNLYVPHSGFLQGKLLGISGVVRKIYYLEEGTAAYDHKNVTEPWGHLRIDVGLLTRELERRGIIDVLKIDRERLARINTPEHVFFYDPRNRAYAGAFGVSPQAFRMLPNAKVVPLQGIDIIPDGESIWLCLLPCLVNYLSSLKNDKPLLDKLMYGLLMMVRSQSAIVRNLGGSLVIKFHPADDAYFDDAFKENFYQYGTAYDEFFHMNDLPLGYEPGLYNFTKFIVINESSASRYIKQYRGADSLLTLKLD